MTLREVSFDGLVGPTHAYGGLAVGNVASDKHAGTVANPRAAALQGLAKMRFVRELGVVQAVLPPHPRPSLSTLRQLGFRGTDEEVVARAAAEDEALLRMCSSAAAMWTANAATVIPSRDAADARVHLVPANLAAMFHRAIEAPTTRSVLSAIFSDPARFVVHAALPASVAFGDEGAANHIRLETPEQGAAHLFAFGRAALDPARPQPARFPARQTLEASRAVARLGRVPDDRALFVQQDPRGIDAGAFHTDVLAVGNGSVLLLHELAFVDARTVVESLRARLGGELSIELATEAELPIDTAVATYPFNSQVVTLPDGAMAIVAPEDARESAAARGFLERVVAADNPVSAVHWVDVRQSMQNGGGPACLRLRVPLEDAELQALGAGVMLTAELEASLVAWVERHYRDRMLPGDVRDPALAREVMTALDELTSLLRLGSVYDFQAQSGFR